jgi:hypothetical protein
MGFRCSAGAAQELLMAVVIEIRDVTKYFAIERPLYKRLGLPFGELERFVRWIK